MEVEETYIDTTNAKIEVAISSSSYYITSQETQKSEEQKNKIQKRTILMFIIWYVMWPLRDQEGAKPAQSTALGSQNVGTTSRMRYLRTLH